MGGTREFRYAARTSGSIGYGLLALASLVTALYFTESEPAFLPIALGVCTLLSARKALHHQTHRLRLEADALVMTSALGTRRIEFDQVRSLAISHPTPESDDSVLTLQLPGQEVVLTDAYANYMDIEVALRGRLSEVPIHDTRRG